MIRATLRMRVRPGLEQDFQQLWEKIALEVRRTPGNLRQDLLRGGEREFVITTDWATREAFHAFEQSGEQNGLTAPLRELRESVSMETADLLIHVEGDER
jgi:heme-degrading monooxygenase HmoA